MEKTAISYETLKSLGRFVKPLKKPLSKSPTMREITPAVDLPFALNTNPKVKNKAVSYAKEGVAKLREQGYPYMADAAETTINKGLKAQESFGKTINRVPYANQKISQTMRSTFNKDMPALDNKNKEVVNRIFDNHELDETKVKKLIPFAGHLNPDVILKERNVVNTLPKEYNQAKDFVTALRKGSGEMDALRGITGIPLERMEGQRLSRHARKRIVNKYEEGLKRIQAKGY